MSRFVLVSLIGATTLFCTAQAVAQEPLDPWTGELELGYVSTQGNTEASSLKGRADVKREVDVWRYHIHFDSLNTSENDERSAERYFLTNKLDYKFGERSYIFGFASYEDDRFSGYEWQTVVATGYGYRILDTGVMQWDAEVGPGYRVNQVEEPSGEKETDIILRGHTRFQWKVSDAATFEQELSVESGNENTISRSITSIKSTIIGQLAMKLPTRSNTPTKRRPARSMPTARQLSLSSTASESCADPVLQ